MIYIDPNVQIQNKKVVRFIQVGNFVEKHFSEKCLDEVIFNLFAGFKSKTRIFPNDLILIVLNYTPKQKRELEKKIYSNFCQFVVCRLMIKMDPERKGFISKNGFRSEEFFDSLQQFTSMEQFSIVLSFFNKIRSSKHILKEDLIKFYSDRLSKKIIKRILSIFPKTELGFSDFAYFLNFLEDKTTLSSLSFWFQVCDLDSNGFLSLKNIETLFSKQKKSIQKYDVQIEYFDEILPRILDMIGHQSFSFTKADLQGSGLWTVFFNFLVDAKHFQVYNFDDPLYYIKSTSSESVFDDFCQTELQVNWKK
jgi:Ca2+-binding EF-hand superfamily protein